MEITNTAIKKVNKIISDYFEASQMLTKAIKQRNKELKKTRQVIVEGLIEESIKSKRLKKLNSKKGK